MQEQEYPDMQRVQQYYRQRQIKPGWQDLVQVLFSGILSSAEGEDARQFMKMIGQNLATQHPVGASATLGELEDNLNVLLARFDWGLLRIEATEQYLSLIHFALPDPPQQQDDTLWHNALIAMLEGAYEQWLNSQGDHGQVPVRWLDTTTEGGYVFRYQNSI